jgi:hypothetical protein
VSPYRVALLLVVGCAPALRETPPSAAPAAAPGPADASRAAERLAEARAAFARRPDHAAVRRAEALFLEAAAAGSVVDGLAGAIGAAAWLANHERDTRARSDAVAVAVDAGQRCEARAPFAPPCEYGLALALGLEVRERPSTMRDGLARMIEHLLRAAAGDPRLDRAGPDRVLALVLVRAPGWPLGPGDPDAGLAAARKAVELFPDHPPNQLALAEALGATGSADDARAAADRGLALARAAAGEPDAPDWIRDGERLVQDLASSARSEPGG